MNIGLYARVIRASNARRKHIQELFAHHQHLQDLHVSTRSPERNDTKLHRSTFWLNAENAFFLLVRLQVVWDRSVACLVCIAKNGPFEVFIAKPARDIEATCVAARYEVVSTPVMLQPAPMQSVAISSSGSALRGSHLE